MNCKTDCGNFFALAAGKLRAKFAISIKQRYGICCVY